MVVILETPQGYIFEKSGDGYFFAVGGKASINEISADSAKRELNEELGLICNNLKIVGIIENFFLLPGDGRRYHELALVFRGHVDSEIDLEKIKSGNDHNQGFVAIRSEQLTSANIKPVVLPKIILDNKEFVHLVNKEV